ncbi:uncharacterized protein LOC119381845 [Rhipicephalus sanguineus]|uniref:Uncharacterized protein n=1 Tax=Rhipicephalus sanguineus TaxID=34632 RepID=A0A9D4T2T3_RHISA|nr:uncharacterized protein LOC119381845 [Rhipicephalus sanguineus]KAH7969390.1 hypothetical protein HPB52_017545 [Rhipicephalus sanguineus]
MAITYYLPKLRRKWRLGTALCSVLIMYSAGHCLIVSFLVSSLTGSPSYGDQWERPVPVGYRIQTSGCTTPRFDPFDPTVRPFIRRNFKRAQCPGKPNFLTIRNGFPSILPQQLKQHGVLPEDVVCFYKKIYRNASLAVPDKHYMKGRRKRLSFDKALKEEFILVECATKKSPESSFHRQFLLNPLLKKNVEKRCRRVRRRTPHNLSVIMLGLDSVSYLNFDRHLPETAKFVREKLGAFELHGYNKVGENSLPNALAFLAGVKDVEAYQALEFGFYDKLSSRLIWRQYSLRGYRTMMFEEWALPGYFCAFQRNGFRHQQTDYYPRHVVMLMEDLGKTVEDDQSCLGPTTQSKELLGYLANFVNVMSKRSFFAFAWFTDITHERLNNAAYADEPFRQALEILHASGALNHTVLAFFSDHGMRRGDIRATYIGRLEDIQPFAFLVFPPWFLEKHPEAAQSLRVNQHRLTTPFDLHATFVELLDYPVRQRPRTAYGLSLLNEIPDHRTCADASVKYKWCSCNVQGDVAVPRTLARAMANQVVSDVNEVLARETRKCAKYRLLQVIDVTLLQATPADLARNTSHYLVDVTLSPGNVLLESTVRVGADNAIKVEDISRGDGYKAQTYCIRGHKNEQYCYCRRTYGGQM